MKKIILVSLFTIISCWGASSEKIRVGTYKIPLFVKSTSEGDFVELVKELGKKINVEVEIILFPPKRAYKELREGNIDALFPAMESRGLDEFSSTSSFYLKEMFLFERVGHNYQKIKNAKVCTTERYTYPAEYIISKGWKNVSADSDETCLKLLDKKRVDLFIGERVTVNSQLLELGLDKVIKFNQYSPISLDRAKMVFSKSFEGKKLSDRFDKALKEIMMDNSYNKILSTGAIEFEPK